MNNTCNHAQNNTQYQIPNFQEGPLKDTMSEKKYFQYQTNVWKRYQAILDSKHSLEPWDMLGVDITTAESLEKTIKEMEKTIHNFKTKI